MHRGKLTRSSPFLFAPPTFERNHVVLYSIAEITKWFFYNALATWFVIILVQIVGLSFGKPSTARRKHFFFVYDVIATYKDMLYLSNSKFASHVQNWFLYKKTRLDFFLVPMQALDIMMDNPKLCKPPTGTPPITSKDVIHLKQIDIFHLILTEQRFMFRLKTLSLTRDELGGN